MATDDDEFLKYVEHVSQMRSLTHNEVINTYWHHINEIEKNGFLSFIIRGSLAWESNGSAKLLSPSKYMWLQSDYYEPIGKSIYNNPVKTYMQRELNQHDMWGGLVVNVDRQDAQSTKNVLEQGFRDISLCCNLVSLLTRASVSWLPAAYIEVNVLAETYNSVDNNSESTKKWMCIPLSRQQEERTSVRVKDDFIEHELLTLFDVVRLAAHHEIGVLLRRSIAWWSTGSFHGSGINRFLNHWESVELLAHYFYRKLSPDVVARPTKSERKAKILDLLTKQPITSSNCLAVADKCANEIKSSIRKEMLAVIPFLVGKQDFINKFFEPDEKTNRSLYDIRNDIAHGNYCDHDVQFTELIEERLDDMCALSREVIIACIQRLPIIQQSLLK